MRGSLQRCRCVGPKDRGGTPTCEKMFFVVVKAVQHSSKRLNMPNILLRIVKKTLEPLCLH